MCFNKNSSSASAQTTNTTSRDERITADAGATIVSSKDGGQTQSTITYNVNDASEAIVKYVLDYAAGVAGGASDFATATQANYQKAAQDANTTEITQLMKQAMNLAMWGVGGFVVWKMVQA
tara:strand:- start:79 stop:441 length:363 start_codon:yes stop_codon:yes gene_type:complete